MKIITWNVNGIRAAERKGELQNLLLKESPDLLLLQEIKGNSDQFSAFLTANSDYLQHYHSAEKKGYAGTGLWLARTFAEPLRDVNFSTSVIGLPSANEGRVSQLDFKLKKSTYSVLSIYFPNGGKSPDAWLQKLVFYDRIHDHMNLLREAGRKVIVGGDMNVAHTEIDIARPKGNDGKIGFHPDERAWMDRLHDDGWVDAWRGKNPGVVDVYSWWNVITKARERNVGWRIDYFLIEKKLLKNIQQVEYLHEQLGSDHCPLKIII
ncbi:MAG: exodeoxyribonuclease-3 [Parasphingorhabdus sp.]|jgi:exodeoxyribonuclease-3